jgi:hypothetical protein
MDERLVILVVGVGHRREIYRPCGLAHGVIAAGGLRMARLVIGGAVWLW